MKFEEIKSEKKEKEPNIKIINSDLASKEIKDNPFFNEYHWAMADWEENKLYLPSKSDEAITFAVASHELGHLVKKDRLEPDRKNFDITYKEELRAWERGWGYLEKYLIGYYKDEGDIKILENIKNKIQQKLLFITELTKPFYLDNRDNDIKEQRQNFLKTEDGINIKNEIDNLKIFVRELLSESNQEKFLNKINWDKFVIIIKKALIDIERDNNANL